MPRAEEEIGVCSQGVAEWTFGGLEGLHGRFGDAVDKEDSASGESDGVKAFGEGELDVVGRELDVGGADEDVVDVEVVGGAVEVEGDAV